MVPLNTLTLTHTNMEICHVTSFDQTSESDGQRKRQKINREREEDDDDESARSVSVVV